MTYGIMLAAQVAGVLTVVRDEARKSLAGERAALIDQVMLVGEQLDFPLIVTEAFDLAPTVFCWSAFCGNASIEQLRQTRDAAHLKLQVKRGRLKLAELGSNNGSEDRDLVRCRFLWGLSVIDAEARERENRRGFCSVAQRDNQVSHDCR